jgi:hypothetical protein
LDRETNNNIEIDMAIKDYLFFITLKDIADTIRGLTK